MLAAVLHGVGDLRLEEVDRPRLKGPKDVLVEIHATAVCGTDVAIYKGKQAARMPLIMGHEASGLVVEVGSDVRKVKLGDRVVVNPTVSCGTCAMCNRASPNLCLNGGLMGRETDGSYCEFAVVPENRLFVIPDSLSFVDGSTFALMTTVTYAQRRTRINYGESVAILGEGASGLLHTALAKLAGAHPIIGVSRSQWKLDLARRMGADLVINALEVDPVFAIKEATGGLGTDVVIEAAGVPQTIQQSMEAVRPGGKVLQFGIGGTSLDGYNIQALYFKDLYLVGSRAMQPMDFDLCIELVSSGKVDISAMVTHRFPLKAIEEGLLFNERNPGKALRVVIVSR